VVRADREGTGRPRRRPQSLEGHRDLIGYGVSKGGHDGSASKASPMMRTWTVLLVVMLSLPHSGCHSKPNMNSAHVILADRFATALVKGDFDRAHELLSREAKRTLSVSELRKQYKEMTDYGGGPATQVQVMQHLSNWPGKQKDDVAWIYVAISGHTFSEGITVIVSDEGGQELIRSIEWGRP
jgi:hypothetical protein